MLGIEPLRPAKIEDIEAAHAIRMAAALSLTERCGEGHWSLVSDKESLISKVEDGTLYVAEMDGTVVGTVLLTTNRIAFYRPEWFARPLAPSAYLMDMSVDPARHGQGIGRRIMQGAERIARSRQLQAIRLDAYQGPAGAGPFYVKCGYELVHRGSFRGIDLEYYEKAV